MTTLQQQTILPPAEEYTVPQELHVSQPGLRAGAFHLAKYCEPECKEFILCRNELKDPRKCLKEGAEVTACGIKFFQNVKQHCRKEFTEYMNCIDTYSHTLPLGPCRGLQRPYDKCVFEKMNLERPIIGYYGRPKIHDSARPPPPPEYQRDYNAEAAAMGAQTELPVDYPHTEEFKRYVKRGTNPFVQ